MNRPNLVLLQGLMWVLVACRPGEVPAEFPAAPVVVAKGESLEGQWAGEDRSVAVFRGIPYAAPPTGERRWRPPEPAPAREGLQGAREFGPACTQHPDHTPDWYRYIAEVLGQDPDLVPELGPLSEDCLHLNIWTANLGGQELQPVMVWIHGGANSSGSPAELPYDGVNLTRKGVVFVSFNYRLNAFGFLAHPALTAESERGSSGNYGLLDQIAALQWIQRHIEVFGGDPHRVTVLGESAGATNIAYLMSSPLARGLFHRAILQSGGYAVSEFRTLEEVEEIGKRIAELLDLDESKYVAAELRSQDAEEILRVVLDPSSGWESIPAIDGWVLEDAPGRIFDRGEQASVPLLIGFNSDEWTTLGHYGPDPTVEDLRKWLVDAHGELADLALELYSATSDEEAMAASHSWQSDSTFACPSRFIADRVAVASGEEVFFYLFSRSGPGSGGKELGAFHGAETPYVMDSLAREPYIPRDPYDQQLAELMSDYWVQFAATGDPNGGGRPVWPAYTPQKREYLELGDEVVTGSGVRAEYCDLWDQLQSSRLQP